MQIGRWTSGRGRTCVVAELGINHNGSRERLQELLDAADEANCDAVKLQKRDVDVTYSAAELAAPRRSPWGTTVGDLKRHLELDRETYHAVATWSRTRGIPWFASVWDLPSLEVLLPLAPAAIKIPSARTGDRALITSAVASGLPLVVSTGMTNLLGLHAIAALAPGVPLAFLACTSAYPTPVHELHVRRLLSLRGHFPELVLGWSQHARLVPPVLAAVALGAEIVEVHVTVNPHDVGSDHAFSFAAGSELERLVVEIREVEAALGHDYLGPLACEEPAIRKLRRVTA